MKNQAFLEALKASKTWNIETPASVPSIPRIKPIDDNKPATFTPKTPITIQLQKPVVNNVTATINTVTNKIELSFSEKPDFSAREAMKNFRPHPFWYNPTTKIWDHEDTQKAREFVNSRFNADLEPKTSPVNASESVIVTKPIEEPTQKPIDLSDNVSPEFAKYRKQVNELLEYLKCEPGDLMLLAIDCLHLKTFARPN